MCLNSCSILHELAVIKSSSRAGRVSPQSFAALDPGAWSWSRHPCLKWVWKDGPLPGTSGHEKERSHGKMLNNGIITPTARPLECTSHSPQKRRKQNNEGQINWNNADVLKIPKGHRELTINVIRRMPNHPNPAHLPASQMKGVVSRYAKFFWTAPCIWPGAASGESAWVDPCINGPAAFGAENRNNTRTKRGENIGIGLYDIEEQKMAGLVSCYIHIQNDGVGKKPTFFRFRAL